MGLPILRPSIRQSSLKNLHTCRAKFLWENRLDLTNKAYKAAPFIGVLFHLIHGMRYEGKDPHQIALAVQKEVETARALAEVHEEKQGGDPVKLSEALSSMEADIELAKVLSRKHWGEFPLDPDLYEVVVVEKEYSVKVPGITMPVEGRVDLLLRLKKGNGGLILVDHKTVSATPLEFRQTIAMDVQPKMYRFLVEESGDFPGEKVIGIIHNVIQRPSCKWKPGQILSEYLDEVEAWYDAKDDPRGEIDPMTGEVVRFKTGPRKGQPKPRWEWAKNAARFAHDPPIRSFFTPLKGRHDSIPLMSLFYEHAKASTTAPSLSNFWPTGAMTRACTSMYGSVCPFLELCHAVQDGNLEELGETIKDDWTTKSGSPACAAVLKE